MCLFGGGGGHCQGRGMCLSHWREVVSLHCECLCAKGYVANYFFVVNFKLIMAKGLVVGHSLPQQVTPLLLFQHYFSSSCLISYHLPFHLHISISVVSFYATPVILCPSTPSGASGGSGWKHAWSVWRCVQSRRPVHRCPWIPGSVSPVAEIWCAR